MTLSVRHAVTPHVIADLAALLTDYAQDQGWHTEPAHVDEIRSLPGEYAPPSGAALVAYLDGRPVGCLVLRALPAKWGESAAELRRLYVAPAARRTGVARLLVTSAEQAAREAGYARLRLVSLPEMTAAHALYESAGFRHIPAYRPTLVVDPVFMEKTLDTE